MTRPNTDTELPPLGGVPLDRPLYNAPIGEAMRRYVRKYVVFSGRASRSEFWWWWLTGFALLLVLVMIGELTRGNASVGEGALESVLIVLWWLFTLVGNLAVGARRLHDANLSGWWQLLHVLPGIGSLVVFVLALLPANPKGTRFDR
ncbi:DUF805 domain-containing protein [Curtobacterium sp. RRHDQ10]|uniref:DUF805 domain-containing protein n=1 Tax=Curtobacterium phyllosphaerae TaxID=3413379 RepID=UPI003BF2E214